MHIRRSFLGWGIFLILAGAVPLAARAGYLTDDQIGRLWQLWPLILIGIGIGLVLSRTRFELVGGLVVAATFGLMVGGLLASGVATVSGGSCGSSGPTDAFASRNGTISGAGGVDLQLDCGTLTVTTAPGDGWTIAGRSSDGNPPSIEAGASSLKVRTPHEGGSPFWIGGIRQIWEATLPQGPTLDIDLQFNAGQATIDLAGARLGGVGLQTNAGSATVDLSAVAGIQTIDFQLNAGSLGLTLPDQSMTGSIQANAGSVRICVPPDAGLRLRTGDNFISSYDYGDHGLVKEGNTWTTAGYATAPVQIDLETTANAGSFALDPDDGCG
jgi:LiaF transmembrane domain